MTSRVVSVAAVCTLLLAAAALVGCSSSHHAAKDVSEGPSPPGSARPNRLIVLGESIAGISLGDTRKSVERAFGHGKSSRRGLVRYFGGRLLVDYWFHDELTTRVKGLETRWAGVHTRSGLHVGSSRQELRALHVACAEEECSQAAGRMPDAPGTVFTIRHGKVARIEIFYG